MNTPNSEDQYSDEDDVFFGYLSLSAVKKRLLKDSNHHNHNHRITVGCTDHEKEDEADLSLKLIETHSTPDILTSSEIQKLPDAMTIAASASSPNLSPDMVSGQDVGSDDSFVKLERMMEKMVTSEKSETKTPEIFILSPEHENSQETQNLTPLKNIFSNSAQTPQEEFKTPSGKLNVKSPVFKTNNTDSTLSATSQTPQEEFKTPSRKLTVKSPLFKTPMNPSSNKKSAPTPSRKYQNVASPVATYIRNSSQVPLLQNVCPKKNYPGISSIPKPMKNNSQKNVGNKENIKQDTVKTGNLANVKLPSVAYKTAKETKMVNVRDEVKMPSNQWAKQVASSIPRAMIVKHHHRETSSMKKPLQKQDESFDNLSLHQADLSLCSQKTSFAQQSRK